ncbi:penicillin-binding protein activator [Alteromonas sp. 1_MG-2023]|uniref:penicillin-binding protein activator n=1 Tax=Alteromonas sp. 1_MG-2023 TaxID=3062669 RepID=UPI0026E31EDD|nr:penicillin-binding protein activator [Alteromonas sp. 1_MG-2023]MDO6568388.1 penicillin-binding protein activator [Alteromonas sp. 1_MG-2023]
MGHIGHFTKRITFAMATATSVLYLAGCGSTPEPTSAPKVATTEPVKAQVEQNITPEHKLVEAKKVWLQTRDKVKRDTLLLDAVGLYIAQGDRILAQQILFEMKQDGVATSLQDSYAIHVAMAYQNDPSSSPAQLTTMLEDVNSSPALTAKLAELQADLYAKQGLWAKAANSVLSTELEDEQKVAQVWTFLNQIPADELTKSENQYPKLQPFFALRQLTIENARNPQQLKQSIGQYKQVYAGHMLSQHLPKDVAIAEELAAPQIRELVVLLPLSGRLAATGETVKDGIMAGYYQQLQQTSNPNSLPAIRFVDTTNADTETMIAAIGDAKFIVGPLLKETVEKLIPALPPGVNMLALNRPDEMPIMLDSSASVNSEPLSPEAVNTESEMPSSAAPAVNYFALAPEDEANQLAEFIYSKGFRAPIVIAAQSNLYQRMNDAFKTRWNTLHEQEVQARRANITSVTFNDSESLREGITQALDVAQSNQRINQIEYMTNEEVYNMPRSRRDIDAIVAFASPQDTQLLNPIIEASLNPYDGKQVPVYATSRSMDYNSGKNQWRDLQNVRFIDMPWMMPDHKWQQLAQETKQTWPDRSTLQNRLFAFGVDAYELLPQLGMLNTLSYITFDGLTGTLTLNENSEVERNLPQAVIRNERVQMLME